MCLGCEEGDVRVVGGDGVSYGTVQVCIDEIWGLITDIAWDDNDAIVICKQLGQISEGESFSKLLVYASIINIRDIFYT